MYHKKLYILSFVFLIVGLTTCDLKDKDKFPEPVVLEGQQIFEDVYGSIYMKEVDSLIVISTMQENPLYNVYNKNQELVSQFGRMGRGPGEFPYPIHIYDSKDHYLFAFESPLLKWNKIDLIKSMEKQEVVIEEDYELPRELNGARDVFFKDENTLVGIYDDYFDKRLDERRGGFYYNIDSQNYELVQLENLKIEPYEVMPATNINAKMPAISPDRSKLAIVSVYSPLIEILNLNTKEVTKINLDKDSYKTEFLLDDFKERKLNLHYTFVHASNEYIYLLYSGQPEEVSDQEERYIRVITWGGDPVSQYTIPAKYSLSSFFVDENARSIYGQSLENDAMYRFKF